MTEKKPGGRPLLALVAAGLAAILVVSFLYKVKNPSMTKHLRMPGADNAMGQGEQGGQTMSELRGLMARMSEEPDNPQVQVELGHMFMSMGAWNKSLVFLDRAVELDPDNLDALRGQGMAFFEMGRRNESAKSLARVVELNPADEVALYNLAVLQKYYQDKGEEARANFKRVLELTNPGEELHESAKKELEEEG